MTLEHSANDKDATHASLHPSSSEVFVKRLLMLLLLTPIALSGETRQSLAIDPKASTVTWTGHAEVGSYAPSGGLAVREGQILLDKGAFAGASLVIDMNSMTQSNPDLLHHLKSADFFDVEHFPAALIKIDRIADGNVFGSMTIKEKVAPFQAPVKAMNLDGRFVIKGKVTLDRTRYGIIYNSASFFSSLGNNAIRNTFEVEFSLTGPGQLPAKVGLSPAD